MRKVRSGDTEKIQFVLSSWSLNQRNVEVESTWTVTKAELKEVSLSSLLTKMKTPYDPNLMIFPPAESRRIIEVFDVPPDVT